MKIVLAHGILGFGSSFSLSGINYFNRVAAALQEMGHEVFAPTVAPIGSLDRRSAQLAQQIAAHWPDDSQVSIIAHSMGGLDARRVIHRHPEVGRRIENLVTIATPHYGSPVADAVLGRNDNLLAYIPQAMLAVLEHSYFALGDLATRPELHDPDCDGVTYREVACISNGGDWLLGSPLFNLTRVIGEMFGPNDGMVPYPSACHASRKPIEIWPVDHGEAIGWPTGYLGLAAAGAALMPPQASVDRYLALVARL